MKESRTAERKTTSVTAEKVIKNFGGLQALGDVSIEIKEKEFFTLLGPSGCGKTTLLRTIAGFERPDGGRILFNDRDVSLLPPWEKNIGFVFQNYALWPNKTVFQNVAYGLELRKLPASVIREKVAWGLELVGLEGVEKKYPEEMSGGQQQRVAIARALVIDPEILLLDEPLSNLDAKLRISLRQQIREIQRRLQLTAIYVTHDQEEALEVSDRIAVMNKGRVLQIGTPEEIYDKPADLFVANFIGKANTLAGKIENGVFVSGGKKIVEPDTGITADGECRLFTRPEALFRSAEESGVIQGLIEKRYYLGNLRRYVVKTADGQSILWETREECSPGENIRLGVEKYEIFRA